MSSSAQARYALLYNIAEVRGQQCITRITRYDPVKQALFKFLPTTAGSRHFTFSSR